MYICRLIYIYINLSTYQLIFSIHRPFYRPTDLSIYRPICLSVELSIDIPIDLPIDQTIYLCIPLYLPRYVSADLSIYQYTPNMSLDLSMYVSTYRYIDVTMSRSTD